jgi:hypothetical protein
VSQVGVDGLPRQSTILSRTCWLGPPPVHSPQTATGHKQDDQAAKTKPPQDAARGFWIRAWGQREPAERATGRLNHLGDTLRHRRTQGWAGLPGPSLIQLRCQSLPESVVGAPRWITRWASRTRVLRARAASLNDDRITVMHQPAQQGPGCSAVSLRDGRPSNDAAISCRTRMGRRRDS